MIYYGICALIPLLFWGIYNNYKRTYNISESNVKSIKKTLMFLSILPMVLIYVLRYKYVGVDTIGYVRFFQDEIREYTFTQLISQDLMRVEVGYRLYVKLISLFSDNYTVYFLFNAIIIFGSIYRFVLKYTENPFVFLFLFMTLGTYSFFETGLRQALAMSICLWAVDFIKNKKLIKFLLTVGLAFLFHKSAAIFLLMYPLTYLKSRNAIFTVYAVLSVVFAGGFALFQSFFNELVGYEYSVEYTGNGQIFLILLFVLFVFAYSINKNGKLPLNDFLLHFTLVTCIMWILRLISRTAERISFYFIFGFYAYFSNSTVARKSEVKIVIQTILLLICFALFVYRNVSTSYTFFWQGV